MYNGLDYYNVDLVIIVDYLVLFLVLLFIGFVFSTIKFNISHSFLTSKLLSYYKIYDKFLIY